jgi:hypothetical protein
MRAGGDTAMTMSPTDDAAFSDLQGTLSKLMKTAASNPEIGALGQMCWRCWQAVFLAVFHAGQPRTLQWRSRDWRAQHGVEPEVFFQ